MKTWIEYIIIAVILIIISLVIVKLSKRDFKSEANKLITYLGGKDNIINAECNMSRLKVILKDVSLANKDGIQKLGAKGIVEIDNQLKIIFDKNAKQLRAEYGIDKKMDLRNCFDEEELKAIKSMEMLVSGLIDCGWGYDKIKSFIKQTNTKSIAN